MRTTTIAQALNSVSYAGPQTSKTLAAGISQRLLRASEWASPRLAELSGLPEAAQVEKTEVALLDRHSLAMRLARIIDEVAPIESFADAKQRLVGVHIVANYATGLWDPTTRTRILVPPNALAAAHRYSLDQSDWSKWLALRTGLFATLNEHAPFLLDANARIETLLERLAMAEALVDALMQSITPSRLPSVEWLRHHGPSTPIAGLLAARLELSSPLLDNRHLMGDFANYVVAQGCVPQLLAAPEKMPDAGELLRPDTWEARVS